MIYRKVSQGEEPSAASRRVGSLSYSDDENDNDDELLLSSTTSPPTPPPSSSGSARSSNSTANATTGNKSTSASMRRTRSERISDKLHARESVYQLLLY
jgi:hypothetical protein